MADEYTRFTRLILKDGTVLEGCECGYANKELWCFLKNRTMADAIQYFSDPAKFETIVFEFGIPIDYTRLTYSGFTELITISRQDEETDVRLIGDHIEKTEEAIRTPVEKDGD
jgi:hypothetical protein